MSHIGLRQLLVLLALTSTLVVSMNVLWVSNSLHQQALLEHSLKNQQGYAVLLASKLQRRLQQGAQTAPFDSLEPTEQQRIWVISNDGKVLFPAGSDLAPAQERGLDGRYREHSALIRDEQGVERMTSVVAVPGTDWLLVLQTALSERPRLQWALVDILAAVLPASLLLILLAWLAGGRVARPLGSLAVYVRNLNRPESMAAIRAVQPALKETAELKKGLLQGIRQLQPVSSPGQPEGEYLDPVTGLSSPDILPELVANISQGDIGFTAMALAVDDYGQVQEYFSQPLRDQALKHLAELLLNHSRELDISVRLGEEVFLLLLPQCPVTIAQRIAERLRCKVQESLFPGVGHMTISIGVAGYQPGSGNPLDTLKRAQQLLISARREGQNRVHAGTSE